MQGMIAAKKRKEMSKRDKEAHLAKLKAEGKEPKDVDKSQLQFNVDESNGMVVGKWNGEQVAFVEFDLDSNTLHIKRTVTVKRYQKQKIPALINKALFDHCVAKKYTVTSSDWYTGLINERSIH